MRTMSVQQMPNGFEVEVPTFGYWMKAGMAFTSGALIVIMTTAVAWFFFSFAMTIGFLQALSRHP